MVLLQNFTNGMGILMDRAADYQETSQEEVATILVVKVMQREEAAYVANRDLIGAKLWNAAVGIEIFERLLTRLREEGFAEPEVDFFVVPPSPPAYTVRKLYVPP